MLSTKSRRPAAVSTWGAQERAQVDQAPVCAALTFYITLQTTYLSGGLSATVAGRERGKDASLGEGGVTAVLQLGVVGA